MDTSIVEQPSKELKVKSSELLNWLFRLAVLVLVGCGLWLRLSNREWGLPFFIWDDEVAALEYSGRFVEGNWLWHGHGFFDYPYFGLYNFAFFYRLHLTLSPLESPSLYTLTLRLLQDARLVSALWGAVSIWLTYLIGKNMFNREVGLIAAFWLTVAGIPVYYGALAKPDGMTTALSLVALFYSYKLAARPKWRFYRMAAIWVGLAISTKFNAAPAGLIFVIAHFLGNWPISTAPTWLLKFKTLIISKWLWGGVLVAVVVFLLATPLYIVDPPLFINGFFSRFVFGNQLSDFKGFIKPFSTIFDPVLLILSGISSNFNHLSYEDVGGVFQPSLENLMLWLSIAGFIYALVKRTLADWLLVAGVILYFSLAYQHLRVPFWHYLMPAIPMLLILTGRVVFDLAGWLGKKLASWTNQEKLHWLTGGLGFLLILALAFPMLANSLSWSEMMSKPTWRIQLDWINQNIPVGSKIAYESVSPRVAKNLYEAENVQVFNTKPYDWYIENGFNYILLAPQNIVASPPSQPATQTQQTYLDLQQKAKLLKEIPGQWLEASLQIWQLPTPLNFSDKLSKEAITLQASKPRTNGGISNGDFENAATFAQDWFIKEGQASLVAGQVSGGQSVLQLNPTARISQMTPTSAFLERPVLSFDYKMLNPASGPLRLQIQVFTYEGEKITERDIEIAGKEAWTKFQLDLKNEVTRSGADLSWANFMKLEFYNEANSAYLLDNIRF